MPIFNNALAGASGGAGSGYEIERSLRFNSGDSAYLNRTPSAAGNRRTWTWSGWVKRSALGSQKLFIAGVGGTEGGIQFHSGTGNDCIELYDYNSSYITQLDTSQVFRDVASFFHLVVSYDTTQSSTSDRVKLYINGEQVTSFATATYPSQNHEGFVNNNIAHTIGAISNPSGFFNGYLADVQFIDGQALAPTDFGKTDDNGVWQPKKYSGSYGTNGFHLDFKDNSSNAALGFDSSSTGLNRIETGSVSNGVPVLGSMTFTGHSGAQAANLRDNDPSTLSADGSGLTTSTNMGYDLLIPYKVRKIRTIGASSNGGSTVNSVFNIQYSDNGSTWTTVTGSNTTHTIPAGLGNTGETTIDDNGAHRYWRLYYSSGTTGGNIWIASLNMFADNIGANNWFVNNLTASVPGLATANQGMDVSLYTGNGGTQSVSGLAFQPDFVWVKGRNTNSSFNVLVDSVRGVNNTLFSEQSVSELVRNTVTAFNSDGFTVGNYGNNNTNNNTYVAWSWKAGGAAVSNTDGSITSQVSASTDYGFSIVSYSANNAAVSVGHGLSSAPKMIFTKPRNAAVGWKVYHSGLAGLDASSTYAKDYYLTLNGNNMYTHDANYWGSAGSNSTTFGTHVSADNALNDMIAYVWSEVAGFSKFGSYTGNGQATHDGGKVIEVGFSPKFVMVKRTDSSGDWRIFDAPRTATQVGAHAGKTPFLRPNVSNSEDEVGAQCTFSATGFTLGSLNDLNQSGGKYIYAAYAAKPSGDGIDSLRDSPTNGDTASDTGAGGEVVGNYATWNPLDMASSNVLTNGNLDIALTGAGIGKATIHVSSGKWYWEILKTDTVNNVCGIATSGAVPSATYLGGVAGTAGFTDDGLFSFQSPFGRAAASDVGAISNGDILGLALDCDNGTLKLYINNVLQTADHFTFTPGLSVTPAIGTNVSRAAYPTNFGARSFAFSAPTGFKSLNTANLPTPTIADGSLYFDTKLYTSTGSDLAVTGLQFSPDFVWVKNRQTANHHGLFDIVRGPNKFLASNRTNAESTTSGSGYGTGTFNSFDANGFTVGSDVGANVTNYPSGQPHVAWAWDGGTSTVTNNDGSIASQVRANPTAGFSIVKYTMGSSDITVGHGLNAEPSVIITRRYSAADSWITYHASLGKSRYLFLNGTNVAFTDTADAFTSTNSSVFDARQGLINAGDCLAYCFAPVNSYSAMGSYTGNGLADGPFIYTGFRPAWIMVKETTENYPWQIQDTARSPKNDAKEILYASENWAEANSNANMDILSNGFKPRRGSGYYNKNGGTIIYLAFAENPFKTARAR